MVRRWRAAEGLAQENAGLAILERLRDRLAPPACSASSPRPGSEGREQSRLAERRFLLEQLALAVAGLPGETTEAGVYDGTSSAIICRALARPRHAFDSFEGLSQPDPVDGDYWQGGDLAASQQQVRAALEPLGARVHRGWIPEVFSKARIERLCLAHVDVDLYQPTRDSLAFFYPRLAPGGVWFATTTASPPAPARGGRSTSSWPTSASGCSTCRPARGSC